MGYFAQANPNPETELHYSNPFELLVAVILSAQCTDKRINLVTPALFNRFPTPEAMAASTPDEIFEYVKSVTFGNTKAKNLAAMANMLVSRFNGQVPATLDELTQLPGAGRKTANVILSVVFNQAALAVDTHVFRVAKRIGLVPEKLKTPLEVENALMKHLPKAQVAKAHHWIILHGRYVCLARKPKCESCQITGLCRYYAKNKSKPETAYVKP